MTVHAAAAYTRAVRALALALLATLLLGGGSAAAPGKAATQSAAAVPSLLRDLKSPDFEKANAALEAVASTAHSRAQVVAGLLDALKTGSWKRCGGDMRDGIARTLAEWQVKAAVPALLALVKSGKSIEHECSE